jgi:adenosylcobinamide-GDP ribazoletransferase
MTLAWVAIKFLSVAGRFGKAPGSPEQIGASAAYFPIVGLLLGLVLTALNRLFDPLVESEIDSAILITGLILLTGAIHLEGLQRTCDRLLAPANISGSNHPLTIYGILSVILVVIFKIRAVEVMGETRNVGLLFAPAFGRWSLVLFLYGPIWLNQESLGRITQSVKAWHLVITTAAILAFAGFVIGRAGLWVALSVSVLALLSRAYFQRRHAEINHDQLGALVEVCETVSFVLLASL